MGPAIVIAAGASSRMGRPKHALALPGGHTFVERLASTLLRSGCAPVIVVARAGDEPRVAAALGSCADRVTVATQSAPERGQLSSVQVGLALLPPQVEPVIVTLVDVPLVHGATVRALCAAWAAARPPVVRPARGDRHGHPIVLGRRAVDALLAAGGPETMRDVLARFAGERIDLPVDDPGVCEDVDTPHQYEQVVARLRNGPPE